MNLAPLFQSIGDVGNQYGAAKLEAAQLKLKQFMESLKQKQEAVSLEDMQERLKRLKASPENEDQKFQQTLAAFRNTFKREPTEDEKKLLFGLPSQQPQKVTNELELWMQQHPGAPVEDFMKLKREEKPEKAVKINTVPGTSEPYQVVDADGKTWNAKDPNLPQNLKGELATYREAQSTGEEKKALVEARKNAETLSREMTMLNNREAMQERKKLLDVARRGITGHSYLTAVAQEVAAAEVTGGQGTTSGDRVIADGFMQLMFGPDAKGIRGSTQVMEVMLKQGGWTDQMIAKLNGALSGGKLSQDVRKQILQTSQRQVGIWDSYVTQFGSLSDDKVSKSVIDKYWEAVTKQNDLKDLGGSKVQ